MNREELVARVLHLHSLGYSYKRIAEEAETSKSTVERIINSQPSRAEEWDEENGTSQSHPDRVPVVLGTLKNGSPYKSGIGLITSQISIYKLDFNDFADDMSQAFLGWQVPVLTVIKYEGRAKRLMQRLNLIAQVLDLQVKKLYHYFLLEALAKQLCHLIENTSDSYNQEEYIELPLLKSLSRECRNALSKDLLDEK